ncbi:sigma-70 family RNA polymerase sigma factor [Nocardiopsis sp. NPDC049922]|uniref:RNA polymerase sigma factor n=1 Tax=Nocardiopsis sp. NPDC049922 TaxID=3155157 RepID=UPI0033E7C8BB
MTDRDLLRALRSSRTSSADAYAYLIDAYGEQLYRRCILVLRDRDTAHVVLRDTLIVARAHIGQVPDADRLGEWLHALAEVECARHTRRGARSEPAVGWRMPEHTALVRARVLNGMTGPELDGYRAHVAARADHFGRDGFPLPPSTRFLARGLLPLLPLLVVLLAALLIIVFAGCVIARGLGRA